MIGLELLSVPQTWFLSWHLHYQSPWAVVTSEKDPIYKNQCWFGVLLLYFCPLKIPLPWYHYSKNYNCMRNIHRTKATVTNYSFCICLFACYGINYCHHYYFNRGSAAVSLLRNRFVVKNKACREPQMSDCNFHHSPLSNSFLFCPIPTLLMGRS